MMENHQNSRNKQRQGTKLSEKKRFYLYLRNHTATASMVEKAIDIKQKNLCRYKKKLQDAGQLWEVCKSACKLTGNKATYLTTDPDNAPPNPQTKLF